MRLLPLAWPAVNHALTGVALQRLARGQQRRPPLSAPGPARTLPTISVVIPARDEALRLAGVLAPLAQARGVIEVVVVDDRSTDATATVARDHGARVVDGAELPPGWVGKPWALQQGLIAAQGEVVVFLDADVLPDPALPAAVADLLSGDADLASAQLRFTCPDAPQRVLHPALLATLVYRLGPLDSTQRVPASVAAINGQCFAARRQALIDAGGFGLVSGASTDDVALARALTAAGWQVVVVDGSELGAVRMYESAREALREWAGRSLALPGASSRPRQLLDLAVVWSVQGLPALRLWWSLARLVATRSPTKAWRSLGTRAAVLLALRLALQGALAKVYRRERGAPLLARVGADGRGAAASGQAADAPRVTGPEETVADPLAMLAPLVDPVAVAALTRGTFAPVRTWRGRDF